MDNEGWDWRDGDSNSVKVTWEKPGQVIIGELKEIRTSSFGSLIYDVLTEQGDNVYFFGCTVLDGRLSDADIGKLIYVEYLGKRKSKAGKEYGDFKVGVKEKPKEQGKF